eukprot:382851-Rhodomonas_salina.1
MNSSFGSEDGRGGQGGERDTEKEVALRLSSLRNAIQVTSPTDPRTRCPVLTSHVVSDQPYL